MTKEIDWNGRCWIYDDHLCLGLAEDLKWKPLHRNWTGNWTINEPKKIFPNVDAAERYLIVTDKIESMSDYRLEDFGFPLIGD